ncbi:MAG TPA: DUF2254 domain-containing protein [Mycobacteriales bacterium]
MFRIRQYLKGSLWVVPMLGGVLGAVLAGLDDRLERTVAVPPSWEYSASTASSALTSIVAATVALLGFVVTISVLVVQMATGTLSPRFMRLWYRDRMQKFVLASFAGTFAFAYGLLRRIEQDSVPSIGVTLAGAAVGGSMLLLLVYLDRFAHGLRPVAVGAQVAAAGRAVLATMSEDPSVGRPVADGLAGWVGTPVRAVRSDRAGTIQAIDHRGLVAAAARADCLLVLTHGVGDFVPHGAVLVEVHGAAGAPKDRQLRAMLALGRERTIDQDPAFALRILVDIAIRALSPAVNDPTTATQLLDYVEDVLRAVGRADVRSAWQLRDKDSHLRVMVPGRAWEEYVRIAVTEIRDYGATSPQVCRRLRAMLIELLGAVGPDRRDAVHAAIAELDAVVERTFLDPAARAFAAGADRQGIGGSVVDRPRSGTDPGTPARGSA